MVGPALGRPVQLAYLVADVHVEALRWAARLGAGPFLVRHHRPVAGIDRLGHACVLDHSSAYGQWGDLQVELLQLHLAGTSADLAADLDRGTGLHHIAYLVADLADEQRRLTALGWPSVLRGTTSSGRGFSLHDARDELGHLVEMYAPEAHLLALYQRVADLAVGWDGRDPVRPLER